MSQTTPIFESKPVESFPKKLIKEINLIQFDKTYGDIMMIGSSSYRATKYPSDYDFLEHITLEQPVETVVQTVAKRIQRVVRNILGLPNHFFLEVKAGLDKRFMFEIGDCLDNTWSPSDSLLTNVKKLQEQGLFSDGEFEVIENNIKTKDQVSYELTKRILRKHYIVRWNKTEIKKGYKRLPGTKHRYHLYQALLEKSNVNIETLLIYDGKVTDISNFIVMESKIPSEFGQPEQLISINISQDLITDAKKFMLENLRQSIEQMYYSVLDHNYMKYAKRVFSYSRLASNPVYGNKALTIVNSELGAFYNIKSELSSILKLVQHFKNPPILPIKNHLQIIKYKLASIPYLSLENLKFITQLLDIISNNKFDRQAFIDAIEPEIDSMFRFINQQTLPLLKAVGLSPPPTDLLPKKRQY